MHIFLSKIGEHFFCFIHRELGADSELQTNSLHNVLHKCHINTGIYDLTVINNILSRLVLCPDPLDEQLQSDPL